MSTKTSIAPLDNETIFKKVFTDKEVFECFIKDMFDVEVSVSKIETEKKFTPPIADIDIKLDIYAETDDHRFLIEIQKIDYDYNFDRFLNYFISIILEQQKRGKKYAIPQTVLGIVIITSPYKLNQITGEPVKESILTLNLDLRDLEDKPIKIWRHKQLFINVSPEYILAENVPVNYLDWVNLFKYSINNNWKITLNLNNKGINKALILADIEKLDSATLTQMQISEAKKATLQKIKIDSKEEGKIEEKEIVAINAIKEGLPNNLIIKLIGLSEERINELRRQLTN